MRSKIYSSEFVKSSSKGQLWIPVFLALAFLMAFPVVELLMMGSWFGMDYELEQIEMLYEMLWKSGVMSSGFVVAVLAGIINGANGFWYLYSSNKVDFYHSLPITRKEMFLQKAYISVWYYLVPYVAFMFMAICIGAMRGFFSLKIMGLAGKMLLVHLLIYFMVYFFTVLVICITGNILMGFLTLNGVFFYGPILGTLLWMYIEMFFKTEYLRAYGIQKNIIAYGSPLAVAVQFLRAYAKGGGVWQMFFLVILTLVSVILAYTAYINRKAENTGKPMSYRWLRIIIKFMAVVPSGLGCGLIFYMMPEDSSRIPWWIFGMVIGTVLSHGVIEVLYRMDFRGFFSAKLQLLFACFLVAFVAVAFQFDIFHFDSYIPAEENIAYINIDTETMNSGNEYFGYVKENSSGKYEVYQWDSPESALGKKGKGLNKDIYEALLNIVHNQRKDRNCDISLPVKYTLNSGRTVYRNYKLTKKEARNFLSACYEEGALLEQKYSFLDLSIDYLEWFSCTYYDGNAYSLFQNEPEEYGKFMEALRKDIEEANVDELLGQPCLKIYLQYEKIPMEKDKHIMGMSSADYYYASLYIYPTFKRALDILKETGYPVSGKELSVSSIEMKYGLQNEENTFAVEYNNKDQVEAIKNILIPTDFLTIWEEIEDQVMMICKDEDGQEKLYGYIPKEKLPEFVEKDIEDYEESGTSG